MADDEAQLSIYELTVELMKQNKLTPDHRISQLLEVLKDFDEGLEPS